MRRQRAHCGPAVDRLAPRGASALQAWLWLLVFIFQNEFRISDSIQPGYLDFDNLPDTNFTCTGKVIGGYYADLETSCQMFHVCTVGQGDEPMDIKFLCLNGTVFDQETRVCERVDEVDCTKSEKFYSLNLELYGSTVPPAVEPERDSSQDKPSEHEHDATKSPAQPDPTPNTLHNQSTQSEHHTEHVEPMEDNIEPEEEPESEDEEEYEEYTLAPAHTTTYLPPTTTSSPRSPTTNTPAPPTTSTTSTPIAPTYGVPSDPTLLTPQEFTFQHSSPPRAPAPAAAPPQAISFQRQNFPHHSQPPRLTLTAHHPASPAPPSPPTSRPADHVFITAAPNPHHYSELEQIDHYELYESAKNSPRRPHDHPAPFLSTHASRLPQGFRPATGQPPRSQIQSPGQYQQRPVQSYQPSERHEILYEERYRPPSISVPTYDYDRYHFDRKRSHNVESIHTEPTESRVPIARSVAPSTAATKLYRPSSEKAVVKLVPKSPPRVIVTASASVSDSNGKKLNYTVGNVVKAVKPIVAINYDDFKESDLIFDPFFLDVPKLTRRRKVNRDEHDLGKRNAIVTLLADEAQPLAAPPPPAPTPRPTISLDTTTSWIPPDYVDDNYEPQVYVEAPPPEVHNAQKVSQKDNDLKKDSFKDNEKFKEVFKSQKVENSLEDKVTSSQSPPTEVGRVTERTTKLVVKNNSGHSEVARLLARSPELRPLLNALPAHGNYNVIRMSSKPSGTFSCSGKKWYELYADERHCRTFHVCARPFLHVTLRCGTGLNFNAQVGECASIIGDVVCNDHRLDHV